MSPQMKNGNTQISAMKLTPGSYLGAGQPIVKKDIEVDMAMLLLSHGYGYDTVMVVTGWSQFQSDVFQDDIAWDIQQGVRFEWLPNTPCKEMDFNPDVWVDDWFRIVSTKYPEVIKPQEAFRKMTRQYLGGDSE